MADSFDTPQSRNEAILQNILGADNELLEPESRIETLLTELLNQSAPVIPESDGDYKLHVEGGVASWVAIS
jgi:hypothetical protein